MVSSFNDNGYIAFGLNRTVPNGAKETILAVDLANAHFTARKLLDLNGTHGAPKLVVHNTAKLVISDFENTSVDDFETTWRSMVLSAVNLAKGVLPGMVETGGHAALRPGFHIGEVDPHGAAIARTPSSRAPSGSN